MGQDTVKEISEFNLPESAQILVAVKCEKRDEKFSKTALSKNGRFRSVFFSKIVKNCGKTSDVVNDGNIFDCRKAEMPLTLTLVNTFHILGKMIVFDRGKMSYFSRENLVKSMIRNFSEI